MVKTHDCTPLTQAVDSVLSFALSPLKETRVIDSLAIGRGGRQGDVYLIRIDKPSDWKETTNRQLAPGTTMGSRHTVDDSVTVLANPNGAKVERMGVGRGKCLGPQLVSETRFTVSHPEHADVSLPAGVYQTYFQCDPQSMQRVRD